MQKRTSASTPLGKRERCPNLDAPNKHRHEIRKASAAACTLPRCADLDSTKTFQAHGHGRARTQFWPNVDRLPSALLTNSRVYVRRGAGAPAEARRQGLWAPVGLQPRRRHHHSEARQLR